MSFEVVFDIPVQNSNGAAVETVGFGPTSRSRNLKTGTLIGTTQEGDVSHKLTFTYERLEGDANLEEAPAVVPFKAYRVTFEEVAP